MSYEPLHHKYRPQTFADLVGQEAIATTLINALCQEKIPPAYLFSGPRGTGKTSSARILAKSLNCLSSDVPTATPCGKCDVCQGVAKGTTLDVVEIDAASNTGVDNIRELIERAQFAPVQCRYKVYIIDEVHMLSNAAFNALLKTLEEPPNRVVFVLATTDPQRVLATIISRCQRYDFRRIPLDSMVKHLRDIANKENININDEAITLVAQIAQGGLRDAESTLDQLSLSPDRVTLEQVWDLVGAVPEKDLMSLLEAIANNDAIAVLDIARRLMDRGREPLIVIQNLAGFYRDLLIAKSAPDRADLVAVTSSTWQELCRFKTLTIGEILIGQKNLKESEFQLKNTTQPRLWLEVTLMGLLPISIANNSAKEIVMPARNLPVQQPEINRDRDRNAPLSSPQPNPDDRANLNHNSPTSEVRSERIETPTENSSPITHNLPVPEENKENNQTEEYVNLPTTYTPLSSQSDEILTQEFNLEEIWRKVLPRVHHNSTKQLMIQMCRLESFDGQTASISVRINPYSKTSWFDDLKGERLPIIEAAFLESLNIPVKIKLIPINSSNLKTGIANQQQTRTSSPQNDRSTPSNTQKLTSPPSAPTVQSEKPIYAPTSGHPSEIKPSPPVTSTVLDDAEKTKKPQIAIEEDDESLLNNAVQHLLQHFQGEIISLTEELELTLFSQKEQSPEPNKTQTNFTEYLEQDEIEIEDEDF